MEKEFNYNQLQDILEELYGEVLSLSEECPGVCYVSARQDETDTFSHVYYIVYKNTNPNYMKTLIFAAAAERYATLPDLTPVHDMEVLRQRLEASSFAAGIFAAA